MVVGGSKVCVQSGVLGQVLMGFCRQWAVSYLGFIGVVWPLISPLGVWVRLWGLGAEV